MNKTIKQHPNSRATKEFVYFIKILESENYKQTDKVSVFLDEKFK
jgi:hypothetical protein